VNCALPQSHAELEQTNYQGGPKSIDSEEEVSVGGDYLPRDPGHENLLRLVGEGSGRA
jgi:hypothetical protein